MSTLARVEREPSAADLRRALASRLFGATFDDGDPAFAARETGELVIANRRLAAIVGEVAEALVGRALDQLLRAVDGGDPLAQPGPARVVAAIREPRSRLVLELTRVVDAELGALLIAQLAPLPALTTEAELEVRVEALAAAEARLQRTVAADEHAARTRAHAERDRVEAATAAAGAALAARRVQLRGELRDRVEDAVATLAANLARMRAAGDASPEATGTDSRRLIAQGLALAARLEVELGAVAPSPEEEDPCRIHPRPT